MSQPAASTDFASRNPTPEQLAKINAHEKTKEQAREPQVDLVAFLQAPKTPNYKRSVRPNEIEQDQRNCAFCHRRFRKAHRYTCTMCGNVRCWETACLAYRQKKKENNFNDEAC